SLLTRTAEVSAAGAVTAGASFLLQPANCVSAAPLKISTAHADTHLAGIPLLVFARSNHLMASCPHLSLVPCTPQKSSPHWRDKLFPAPCPAIPFHKSPIA